MQHVRQVFVRKLVGLAIDTADEVADDVFALALNALQHHMLGALGDQCGNDAMSLFIRDVGARPVVADGLAQNDGRFGQIRSKDVGTSGKLGHSGAQLGRIGGVNLAVISHNRVDHAQCVGVHGVQLANQINLLGRAQKAAVNGIDLNADALPRVDVILQDIGGIVHVEARERRVAAEQASRHGADIAACRGKNGDRHAKRALAVTAQVMNSSNARDIIAFALVQRGKIGGLIGHLVLLSSSAFAKVILAVSIVRITPIDGESLQVESDTQHRSNKRPAPTGQNGLGNPTCFTCGGRQPQTA